MNKDILVLIMKPPEGKRKKNLIRDKEIHIEISHAMVHVRI